MATAIEADHRAFQLYTGGVFDDATCGTELDHGVLIAGYGTDDASGKDYWVRSNSHGSLFSVAHHAAQPQHARFCPSR